ncbi:MAG: hypothetical protein R3A51_02645 [Nannocystaceae bacterium]
MLGAVDEPVTQRLQAPTTGIRARLGALVALLLVPLLLLLHVPLLVAVVPGAVLGYATYQALGPQSRRGEVAITPEIVDLSDPVEILRVRSALPVQGSSRRLS